MATILQPGKCGVYVCYQFDFTFYVMQTGKAFTPLRLFPEFTANAGEKVQASQSTAAPAEKQTGQADLRQLIDSFAHYQSFNMDRTEEIKMADELVAGGTAALNEIMTYLLICARGTQREYWRNNATALVRLIGRFPNADYASQYKRLMACQSNIWEFQTQIKDVAEQELLKLKKQILPIRTVKLSVQRMCRPN